jgi:nicotinate phosphoribosyltransferase
MDGLKEQLDHMFSLKDITPSQLSFLKNLGLFSDAYLEVFRQVNRTYGKIRYKLGVKLNKYGYRSPSIEILSCPLWISTLYETQIMTIVNRLYTLAIESSLDSSTVKSMEKEGLKRLNKKITYLTIWDDVKIMEFGTRRAYSPEWQELVLKTLLEKCPGNILGTSNVYLAERFGIKPLGTNAHELPMMLACKALNFEGSQEPYKELMKFLRDWDEEYGGSLNVVLPDTFGTKAFLEEMDKDLLQKYSTYRQDSGDPKAFTDMVLSRYKKENLKVPLTMIFSDGLTLKRILALRRTLRSKVQEIIFGWGTDLTNDRGVKPLSIVMKVSAVYDSKYNFKSTTVKLSDNPEKTLGKPEEVLRYKKVFNYKDEDYSSSEVVF